MPYADLSGIYTYTITHLSRSGQLSNNLEPLSSAHRLHHLLTPFLRLLPSDRMRLLPTLQIVQKPRSVLGALPVRLLKARYAIIVRVDDRLGFGSGAGVVVPVPV